MARYLRTPQQKWITKLNNILKEDGFSDNNGLIQFNGQTVLTYTNNKINYTKWRYFPRQAEQLVELDFEVEIPISHETLNLLGVSPINPPNGANIVLRVLSKVTEDNYDKIIIGSEENSIDGSEVSVDLELYQTIVSINKEENVEKAVKIKNRAIPFFMEEYGIEADLENIDKDYSLLLKEVINSGEITQNDLSKIASKLESGEVNEVVIQKQINKQVSWLIDSIETILEEDKLTIPKAKKLGNEIFGFLKSDIKGPEQLLEKILTKYGQSALFGVPALLNTNKYVINPQRSRSQFDLILVNHLGDIEIVELKRPDSILLDYDSNRGKFFPTKDLAIALAQSERYISAAYKDNDQEYLIDGKTIRLFIQEKIGNNIFTESVRPTAIIIMGSWAKLSKDYSKITAKAKQKITEEDYNDEALVAYRELKQSFKNIKIMTYSELLEHARTRLELVE